MIACGVFVGVGIVVKSAFGVLAKKGFSVVITCIVVVSSRKVDFSAAAVVNTDIVPDEGA